jgi:lipopolysaccharide transport system permease protein
MIRDVLQNLRLIQRLAFNDFRGRYSGSALGVIWAVVQPLTMIVMYTMIFAVVLKVKVGARGSVSEFGLFLICGMIAFNAVADGIRKSASVFVEQAHLLRRLPMPPVVLPASRVLTTMMEMAIALVIFFVLMPMFGNPPGWHALGFLVLVPVQVAFSLGISTAIACITVMFRDVGALTESLLTIWFLGTPIFYPRDFLPPILREIIDANPMTAVVEGYRSLILFDRLPPIGDLVYVVIFGAFFILAGRWVYGQTRAVLIDHV